MPKNPLLQSLRVANRTNRELTQLLNRYLGTKEHPRGKVLSAYRQARLAMMSAYREEGPLSQMNKLDIISSLRISMGDIAYKVMDEAESIGRESARRQYRHYEQIGVPLPPPFMDSADMHQHFQGWWSTIEGQLDGIQSLILADADPVLIYGDGERLGALQPAPVNRDGTKWIGMAVSAAFLAWLLGRRRRPDEPWPPEDYPLKKQAVAAIDLRTTDCCLRVHGQIMPLNKPFRLTGTPRYADKMQWPPFHMWCRTVPVLYMEEFDLGLTERMRGDATDELERRGP